MVPYYGTSSGPQDEIGNYLGPCSTRHSAKPWRFDAVCHQLYSRLETESNLPEPKTPIPENNLGDTSPCFLRQFLPVLVAQERALQMDFQLIDADAAWSKQSSSLGFKEMFLHVFTIVPLK